MRRPIVDASPDRIVTAWRAWTLAMIGNAALVGWCFGTGRQAAAVAPVIVSGTLAWCADRDLATRLFRLVRFARLGRRW